MYAKWDKTTKATSILFVATHRILLCARYKCGVKKKRILHRASETEHAELNETSSNIRYSKEILWTNVYAFPKKKYTKSSKRKSFLAFFGLSQRHCYAVVAQKIKLYIAGLFMG